MGWCRRIEKEYTPLSCRLIGQSHACPTHAQLITSDGDDKTVKFFFLPSTIDRLPVVGLTSKLLLLSSLCPRL